MKDLFGAEIDDEKQKKPPSPSYLIAKYFCEKWKQRYGSQYPFSSKDAGHARTLAGKSKTVEHGRAIIDAFIDSVDKWHVSKGHSFGTLICDLPRFIATSNSLEYSGSGVSLRVDIDDADDEPDEGGTGETEDNPSFVGYIRGEFEAQARQGFPDGVSEA